MKWGRSEKGELKIPSDQPHDPLQGTRLRIPSCTISGNIWMTGCTKIMLKVCIYFCTSPYSCALLYAHFFLSYVTFHIRKGEMLLTLLSSSIIHLMEYWNCVSATTLILLQTWCATVALPVSCLVVFAFLFARYYLVLLSPLFHVLSPDGIRDMAFCWTVCDPHHLFQISTEQWQQ